jgi:tetratricopeptide (TPR) repeat protein
VDALLTARGPLEARRDLQIRVTGDPRDVAGRLALAALDERIHRPSEAIDALEAVVALGGPLGVRWHAEDQARLARLIAARGRARLARGAATALADLERARGLGAAITEDELRRARAAGAIVALRHSDAEVRDDGRRTLAALATPVTPVTPVTSGAPAMPGVAMTPGGAAMPEDAGEHGAVDEWAGARTGALPEQRGRFGVWLWEQGARRAAWDELSAWHAATHPPRDQALQEAYLTAARWWTPLDRPGPPAEDLVGPARCAFALCMPHEVAGENLLERAYLVAPLAPPVRDPADAAALAVITLHQALRGETSWGAALAARVDLPAFADPKQLAKLPRYAQPIFARLAGREVPVPGDGATPDQRLVIAAERVLAGAGAAEIAALIGDAPYADELRRVAATRAPFTGDARSEAAARHASLVVRDTARVDELHAIVVAYARDPAIADRLGRDAVAGAADAAAMHAILAALFDALGDPARARAAWQAAIDASAEPAFLRGLAEALARQGDPDAALVAATAAAAASGDPAVVWTSVTRALAGAGKYVHALDAARSAIDLSGPETLAAALEVAIAASQALGRDVQAAGLAEQRARVAQSRSAPGDTDPTDAAAALEAYKRRASGSTIARMWVASRWNPHDVELRAALLGATTADDARHAVITGELVDLAGDRDPALRRAAVAALISGAPR